MTDVRLTATNPEDSSVVPVACNSRGELLVSDVVIDQLNNDFRVNGELVVHETSDPGGPDSGWYFTDTGDLMYFPVERVDYNHLLAPNGYTVHSRLWEDIGQVLLAMRYAAIQVKDNNNKLKWQVGWDGEASFRAVVIPTEPDNADHYVTTKTAAEGEPDCLEYKGPVLDVAAELGFLRDQLRQTMERLKMTPEGGWEIWDGSE